MNRQRDCSVSGRSRREEMSGEFFKEITSSLRTLID